MKPSTKWIAGTAAAVAIIAIAAFAYRTPSGSDQNVTKDNIEVATVEKQSAVADGARLADEKVTSASTSGDSLQTMSFEGIKSAAARGSVINQRRLADIYAMCGPYSVNPRVWLETLDHLASLAPGPKESMGQVKKRLVARCNQVDGGRLIPKEALGLWTQQAAKNGDVASRVRLRVASSEPLSGKEASELADAVLASSDPQAMWDMSNLMSGPIADELPDRYAKIAGDPVAGAAWGIAACRAGVACGSGSMLMDSVCMSTGRCNYSSYESFLMGEMVPAGERARLSAMISSISALRRP